MVEQGNEEAVTCHICDRSPVGTDPGGRRACKHHLDAWETGVVVAEVFRVTYEGNDYEDTFSDFAAAEAWARQWKDSIIHRRVTKTTIESSDWEPMSQLVKESDRG